MKETKFIWIFPKQCVGRLGSANIFYGTEKDYKKWIKSWYARGQKIADIMNNTTKFAKIQK